MEAPIQVNLIDHYNASGPQDAPISIEFEPGIVFRMDAVVEEEINRAEASEQCWQASPT
jgi:hypothetical protein